VSKPGGTLPRYKCDRTITTIPEFKKLYVVPV
jgi:hypothetical protein